MELGVKVKYYTEFLRSSEICYIHGYQTTTTIITD